MDVFSALCWGCCVFRILGEIFFQDGPQAGSRLPDITLGRFSQWHDVSDPGRRRLKGLRLLSTVNKSSRPLREPWFRALLWFSGRVSFFFFFLFFLFYSPHRARGRIKDWWELSESVYCSRDPRMCYEWEDCVAVLPHRGCRGCRSAGECLTIKVGLFILFFFFHPPPFSLHSVRGELRAAYSYAKCDEILLVTVRGAFTFPWTHASRAQL